MYQRKSNYVSFSFAAFICNEYVIYTVAVPISVVDSSAQNLAQLKNSSYVYMVYNATSSCYPHCRQPVSYPAIPLYGDDTYLLHTTRRLIDVLTDINSNTIKNKMLVCAMPTYLITQQIKSDKVVNCITVNHSSCLKISKSNKSATQNKSVQVGKFLKFNKVCCTIIWETKVWAMMAHIKKMG